MSLYSMLSCGSVIAELITSRAVDRSSPTTMGMCGVPGSTAVMVDSNRPGLAHAGNHRASCAFSRGTGDGGAGDGV